MTWLKSLVLVAVSCAAACAQTAPAPTPERGRGPGRVAPAPDQPIPRNDENSRIAHEQLLEKAWGFDFYGQTRTVDVHIAQLRKRLVGSAVKIETVTGPLRFIR